MAKNSVFPSVFEHFELIRAPRGAFHQHILDVLSLSSVASLDSFAHSLPHDMLKHGRSSLKAALRALIAQGLVVRVMRNCYVAADDPVTWRTVVQEAAPLAGAILRINPLMCTSSGVVSLVEIHTLYGYRPREVGAALRLLQSWGLAFKKGSRWSLTGEVDRPVDADRLRDKGYNKPYRMERDPDGMT